MLSNIDRNLRPVKRFVKSHFQEEQLGVESNFGPPSIFEVVHLQVYDQGLPYRLSITDRNNGYRFQEIRTPYRLPLFHKGVKAFLFKREGSTV